MRITIWTRGRKVVAFLLAGNTTRGALPEAMLDGVVRPVTDTSRTARGHYPAH